MRKTLRLKTLPGQLAVFLVRFHILVWLVLAITAFVMGYFALGIRFDFSPQTMYDTKDQLVEFSEQNKHAFGYEDAIVVVILVATGDRDTLTADALTWQAETADKLEQLSVVDSVRALPRLQVPRVEVSFQKGIRFIPVPLVTSVPLDEESENRVRSLLERSNLLDRVLISEDRRVAAIHVQVDPNLRDIDSMDAAVSEITAVLHHDLPPRGYSVHLSGLPVVRVDIVRNLKADQAVFLPGAGLVFFIAFAVMFRRVLPTVMPLVAVAIGLAWTIGIITATGQTFNLVSNVLPSLMLIVGASNCIHILLRHSQHLSALPHIRVAATVMTMSRMVVCCLLTFLTTAVGFASIMAAQADVLRGFSWQATMGMILLYVSVMLCFGSVLPYVDVARKSRLAGGGELISSSFVAALHQLVDRYPRIILLCSTGVVAASVLLARNIETDSYLMETYPPDHPTMQNLRIMEDQLGGVLPLEINLTADDPERLRSPEVYRNISELQRIAERHDYVTLTRSYVDVSQELYAMFRRRPELRDELPPLDDEGKRRIHRSFWLAQQLGDVANYRAFITPDGKQTRIIIQLRDVGTRRTLALIKELEKELQSRFPPSSGITARLTSDAYLAAKALQGISRDLTRSLLTASLAIFGVIGVMFRSLRLASIAAVCNLTPLAVTLGYMGLLGYQMTIGTIVVFAMSLGIAVDDTIHFLSRFSEESEIDCDVRRAVRKTFLGTGRAILLTTILTVAGFSVLLTSDFIPTRRFAELTCTTMIGALLGDLFILPAALLFRSSAGNQQTKTMPTSVSNSSNAS